MERIRAIEEVQDVSLPGETYSNFDGYRITTDNQKITLAISNGQSCCEDWGYFMSEDDPQKFVGAEFLGVRVTDTNLTGREVGPDAAYEGNNINTYDGDVMFVNIQTDRGVLQFVAYNAHNGYYGHSAIIAREEVIEEKYL